MEYNDKLVDVFAITTFFDNARWGSEKNYNLINFCTDSLSDDEKLLVHWLCYVTDRQMPFDRIWSIGGFIISEIVHQMNRKKDLSILNPSNKDASYFIKRRHYPYKDFYGFQIKDYDHYLFTSFQKTGNNERLLDYGFDKDTLPFFIHRYYPSDYKAFLQTFSILEDYDYSLIKYIIAVLNRYIDNELLIPKLLFSLYLLTYYDTGQPKASDISYGKFVRSAKRRKKTVLEILNSEVEFQKTFGRFRKKQIYSQKRAWCSLRDFFKSPEFKSYFFGALQTEGFEHIEKIQDPSLLHSFELPGDVWNNNPKFKKCILKGTKYIKSTNSMPIQIREIFIKENIPTGYPEQFDITFDFVPRMCDLDNCDICPFGILNGVSNDFDLVCRIDKSKYCPVLLTNCGYKRLCEGEDCTLLKILKRSP